MGGAGRARAAVTVADLSGVILVGCSSVQAGNKADVAGSKQLSEWRGRFPSGKSCLLSERERKGCLPKDSVLLKVK